MYGNAPLPRTVSRKYYVDVLYAELDIGGRFSPCYRTTGHDWLEHCQLVWKVRRGNTTVVKTTEQVPTAGSFLDGPNVKPLQRAQCRLYWHDT